MLTAHSCIEVSALKRKARSIELQAGRSAPILAAQLRSLAARYYAEADALIPLAPHGEAGTPDSRPWNHYGTSPLTP